MYIKICIMELLNTELWGWGVVLDLNIEKEKRCLNGFVSCKQRGGSVLCELIRNMKYQNPSECTCCPCHYF